MRELTVDEKIKRDRLKENFGLFFQEMMPVLKDFFEMLDVSNAAMVMVEAKKFLLPLDNFMRNQTIEKSDRVWITTRIGYFIGELLVQELG